MTTKYLILNWSKAQKAGASLPCPRCGRDMNENLYHNALSRRADIYICSHCGTEEAFEDMSKSKKATNEKLIESWFLVTAVLGNPEIKKIDDNSYRIRACREVYLTQEDIDDIMCSALEGGICYWCTRAEVVEDKYYGEYASEQISRSGSLKLYDAEDDAEHILTIDKLIKGFSLACKKGYGETYSWYTDDGKIDTGMIDAEAADIIIQFALFGDIIYG